MTKNETTRFVGKSIQNFLKTHVVQGLLLDSMNGSYESYICRNNSKSPKGESHKSVIVQSIKVSRDKLSKARKLVSHLQKLNPDRIHPMLNAYHCTETVYVSQANLMNFHNDLYKLAYVRSVFSENQLGSIANQLLMQLSHLH